MINLPQALVINPVTISNWEGVGAQADTVVLPSLALETAHRMALKELISAYGDERRSALTNILANTEAAAMPLKAYTFTLEGYQSASQVYLSGWFNNWALKANVMIKGKVGGSVSLILPRGMHEYKFIVDGQWITDPMIVQTGDAVGMLNSLLRLKHHRHW